MARLPLSLVRQIRVLAKQHDRSLSAELREALRHYIKTVSLLTLICLFIAAPAQAIQPNAINQAPQGTTFDVYGYASNHRVYLFHGLSGTRQAMRVHPYDRLIGQLENRGWQIIVPSLPYDAGTRQPAELRPAFADGGHSYRQMWQRRFHALLKSVNARYGRVADTTVMGISWGGFHALQAACNEPSISSYAVHEPVVQPTNLIEFRDLSLPDLPLGPGCLRKLAAKTGFIGYGTADTRVGVEPTVALIGRLGVESCRYAGLDHSTTLLAIDNMLRVSRGAPAVGCSSAG